MPNPKIDELSTESRAIYERTRLKMTYSLFYTSLFFLFLSFTAASGAKCNFHKIFYDNTSSYFADSEYSLSAAYGFACFCLVVSAVISLVFAIQNSPLCLGTPVEKSMLKAPNEVTQNSSGIVPGGAY